VSLSLIVQCFAIASRIMFLYRLLFNVSLSLLVLCFATASCIMFRYRFLFNVSLPLLVQCFAIAYCSMFRYRFLFNVSPFGGTGLRLPLLAIILSLNPTFTDYLISMRNIIEFFDPVKQ
jgi:hypothetical protein